MSSPRGLQTSAVETPRRGVKHYPHTRNFRTALKTGVHMPQTLFAAFSCKSVVSGINLFYTFTILRYALIALQKFESDEDKEVVVAVWALAAWLVVMSAQLGVWLENAVFLAPLFFSQCMFLAGVAYEFARNNYSDVLETSHNEYRASLHISVEMMLELFTVSVHVYCMKAVACTARYFLLKKQARRAVKDALCEAAVEDLNEDLKDDELIVFDRSDSFRGTSSSGMRGFVNFNEKVASKEV